jgi:hypothetical protein
VIRRGTRGYVLTIVVVAGLAFVALIGSLLAIGAIIGH